MVFINFSDRCDFFAESIKYVGNFIINNFQTVRAEFEYQ